jgi:hypothetical protein
MASKSGCGCGCGCGQAEHVRMRDRGAQTGVFELDIRISNPPYIHRGESLAPETGLKSRNVEKRINDV